MLLSVVLPVVVFVVMATLFITAVWRVLVAGAEARRSAQTLRLASDVAHRSDICIGELAHEIECLRHRGPELTGVGEAIAKGSARLSSLAAEAHAVQDRTTEPAVASLVDELERALRSLELIEHGREILASGNLSNGEGETSVKRGYLNLLHAEEAIRQRGADIRAVSAPASVLGTVDRR